MQRVGHASSEQSRPISSHCFALMDPHLYYRHYILIWAVGRELTLNLVCQEKKKRKHRKCAHCRSITIQSPMGHVLGTTCRVRHWNLSNGQP